MVQPRLRGGRPSSDLYLPHVYPGADDSNCKTSSKKLEKRLRLVYYRIVGMNQGPAKEIILCIIFLLVCFLAKTPLSAGIGVFGGTWSSSTRTATSYPWKRMSRPANLPKPTTPSKVYTVPESMSILGDKSDFYAHLRKAYDSLFPTNASRSLEAVRSLQKYDIEPFHSMDYAARSTYDIYNCPAEPPVGYPFAWRIVDILAHWPANDPEPRHQVFQSLCVFDFVKDASKAHRYREAEVPFVVRGDPAVAQTVERWNTPHYVPALLGQVEHDTEYSVTNHFLYWNKEGTKPSDWKQPTQRMTMTYREWGHRANVSDTKLGPSMPHWYFRVAGCREGKRCAPVASDFIFDELPFFQPKQNSLYVKEQTWQRGVFCRFGMKGVIAENHFDGERNFVTVLGGERRYILAAPEQCPNMSLFPMDHPSSRHSAIDWSDPNLEAHPEFAAAKGNEVVLQAGDSLFIPSLWFHHIISLSMNIQCNTRSGMSMAHADSIGQCGYSVA